MTAFASPPPSPPPCAAHRPGPARRVTILRAGRLPQPRVPLLAQRGRGQVRRSARRPEAARGPWAALDGPGARKRLDNEETAKIAFCGMQ
jgi:hypothetical protein